MTDEDRRLLEVLSNSANGCTDAQLLLSGFMPHQMVSMVRAGTVTAKPRFTAGRLSGAGFKLARRGCERFGISVLGRSTT
jgi:hypothetical protein